jgi:hypothetical protein
MLRVEVLGIGGGLLRNDAHYDRCSGGTDRKKPGLESD